MDKISPEERSRVMKAVGKRNTAPEMRVRRVLHRLGYRYRLHNKRLPGTPDIVFNSRKKAIFVHGCFWHGHDCRQSLQPKSRTEYWQPKIARNAARDRSNEEALLALGWNVMTVWECSTKHDTIAQLAEALLEFLDPVSGDHEQVRRGKRMVGDGKAEGGSLHLLTPPQRAALVKFSPGQARGVFPDINPRTASALWTLGLLSGEIIQGKRLYLLSARGEQIRIQLLEHCE